MKRHSPFLATLLVAAAGFAVMCTAQAAAPSTTPVAAAAQTAPHDGPARIAIVVQDQAALRAAPRDSAPQQVMLWQGDALEIRGERMDHLQVYDHRRERAGYVRVSQVRTLSLDAANAPEMLSVVRFLRDTPGAEALGIAYVAAYLRAADAKDIGAEPFDALGGMADRLARRASARQGKSSDALLAAHLEVVAAYGVGIASVERPGRVQLCYDGEAFRRVLAMPSQAEQRARAALALTRQECMDPNMHPLERQRIAEEHARMLDGIDTATLPDTLKNRVRMRRAGVWSGVAFDRQRRGDASAQEAASRAVESLAGVDKKMLTDADEPAYAEAAVRTGASRWAAGSGRPIGKARLSLVTNAGEPGETCLSLVDARRAQAPLLRRCTYATVWTGSATVNATGNALAVAVQPLAAWRELWVFHQVGDQWVVDAIPPATSEPELGIVEFAGWVPGGKHMLVAREARVEGRIRRSFEMLRLDTLAADKRADRPGSLSAFHRWQDAGWKRDTLILR